MLLDAAEQLLLEEGGYAAVTSRRIAEKAGLKPQLVHYYFRTMEDLFLAVFRRMAEAGLEVLTEALASPQPLWALWRFSTQPEATRLTMEFMGLANHRKALRSEIVYYAERFREEQNKAIAAALKRYGVESTDVPPVVWTVFATSCRRAWWSSGRSACRRVTPRRSRSARRGFAGWRETRFRRAVRNRPAVTSFGSNRAHPSALVRGHDHPPVHRKHAVDVRFFCLARTAGRGDHRPLIGIGQLHVEIPLLIRPICALAFGLNEYGLWL